MASKLRPKVFRVTGLSTSDNLAEVETRLRQVILEKFTEDEKQHLQIDVQCVPACGDDGLSALAKFTGGTPAFLIKLESDPLDDLQFEMDDDDITFDLNFFGFTQLYQTAQDKPITVDIIAITGLGGNAYGSWTSRSNLPRMWLRDFLSRDMPQCRTMIYGYNSNLSSHGIDTVLDYGRELLEGIKNVRNTQSLRERPLIFVAHSFGGIILAHTLIRARQADDRDDPTLATLNKATYGLLFLGTPHKGLFIEDILSMIGGDNPRRDLVEELRKNSSSLQSQVADFRNLARDYKIVSFYETQQSRRLKWDEEKSGFRRTGEFITSVEPDSALLQLPDNMEVKVKVDADHSNIAKFKMKKGEPYTTALRYLKQFEFEAGKQVPQRFHQKITLVLPRAVDAEYNAYENQHDPMCHPETRRELLGKIAIWADNSEGGCIFWLNGKAGTGKSTISRTLAKTLYDKGKLGASFFFRREEGGRSNASRFFTTIAAQIVAAVPPLARHVQDAINADPTIPRRVMKEQFEKLILKPLTKIQRDPLEPLVVVIDALDECNSEDDVRVIIFLLSRAKSVTTVGLKFFVTSRPETIIHREFMKIPDAFNSEILDTVDEHIIEHDIAAFLKPELAEIRDDYNLYPIGGESLPVDWPSEPYLRSLIEMAVPLFIFAATACRFIKTGNLGDPEENLRSVLEHRTRGQESKLDEMYLFILKQLLNRLTIPHDQMMENCRVIIGSIVVLFDPLPTACLALLLRIPKRMIDNIVGQLPSVMNIPSDKTASVRPLHLSFRDFLLDAKKRHLNPFWVDEVQTHAKLASSCLELLLRSGHLKMDICGLETPGKPRAEVSDQKILECLPAEVQYACLYWVHHLKESESAVQDGDQAHCFLERHFLHWLEALSLIGRVSESIGLMDELERVVCSANGSEITRLIRDGKRFVLNCRPAIEVAPLQLYYSALIFSPQKSVIREKFEEQMDGWITKKPAVEPDWSTCLQTLADHQDEVNSVAFSHDSRFLASGSSDSTVKIWDATTWRLQQTLENPDRGSIISVAISHDLKLVASGSTKGICVWNVVTSSLEQTLEDCNGIINSVVFSHDSELIAAVVDRSEIRVWDTTNGSRKKIFDCKHSVNSVAISHDSKLLASGLAEGLLLLDVTTGSLRRTLDKKDYVPSVAFSHDSALIASGSTESTENRDRDMHVDYTGIIKVWDVATGTLLHKLRCHGTFLYGIAFSHDSKLIASGADTGHVEIWDTTTWTSVQSLRCSGLVNSVAFSHDSKLLASGSKNHAVKIWNVATIPEPKKNLDTHCNRVNAVTFSDDLKLVASASNDWTVKIWNTTTGSLQQTIWSGQMAHSVAFSRDSRLVVFGDWGNIQGCITVCDAETGNIRTCFGTYETNVVTFSHDSKYVVSGLYSLTTHDLETRAQKHMECGNHGAISCIAYSHDSRYIAAGWTDKTITIWSTETNSLEQTFKVGATPYNVSFDIAGSRILTELGSIKLGILMDPDHEGALSEAQPAAEAESGDRDTVLFCNGCGLSLDNSWITWNGDNALWLPPDYRPYCLDISSFASSSVAPSTATNIAIGCPSGRVFTIGFSESGPLTSAKPG
ncbi:hypothetical protein CC80DRAFT_592694 [Byssothecium circinans]|uniref:Mitochondrial division protein 1 n=1 Tax=Byssothecium circinans TaxID=147558 RepID=A0A6A5U367_9PLEO|nr:hypothetical protein CC80DRAFT_592694 [Byssothecium circinans]